MRVSSSDPSIREKIAQLFGALTLVALLWLWPFMGNGAAYVALLLSIPAIAAGWRHADAAMLVRSRWIWAFWAGFVLVCAAFVLQPGWPSIAAISHFAFFALSPLMAMAIAPLARARMTLTHFSCLCFIGAVLAGGVGIYGIANGIERITAPSFSPIHFANIAMILAFLGLALVLSSRSPWRWLALLGPVFALIASVASGSRSAVLVGLALAIVFGFFSMKRLAAPLWVKLLIPLLMVGAVIGAFYVAHLVGHSRAFGAFEAAWGTLSGNLAGDSSTAFRIDMYRAGWLAFLDSPLWGHGWHNQIAASFDYLSEAGQQGYRSENWGYLHNDALSLAVAAGILGFLAYGLFIFAPMLAAISRTSPNASNTRTYLALGLSLGILVSGMTDVLFMVELPKVLLILTTAILAFAWEGNEDERSDG